MKHLLSGCMLMLVAAFFTSCDKDGFCLKGEGKVETRTFQLSDIDAVKLNGSSRVYIRYGTQQHVEVKGQPNILDVLNTDVKNGTWTIETNRCIRKHKTLEIYLTLPSVDYLELNGSGSLEMQDTFEEPEIQCQLNGSGKINARFITDKSIIRLSGSGDILLNGSSRTQNVSLSGSGSVKAFDFSSEHATVNISGSGNVKVRTSQTLDVNISGSGKVYYRGNPTLNSNITGSGKLVKD